MDLRGIEPTPGFSPGFRLKLASPGGNTSVSFFIYIKKYVEEKYIIPIKIRTTKNVDWPKNSKMISPLNSTISKILKSKLKMFHKVIHKWNIKQKDY